MAPSEKAEATIEAGKAGDGDGDGDGNGNGDKNKNDNYSEKALQFEWDDSGDEVVLGIDEAGRGPVLGPMVYACAFCKKKDLNRLKKLGADDSKQLTEVQRELLRKKLDDSPFMRSLERVIHADEISEKMLRRVRVNLNVISHDAALDLVRQALLHNIPVTEVFVDTVGTAETYAEKFRATFPQLEKVVVAKKADAIYPIVGAASIVAKTTRDRIIQSWTFPEVERARKLPHFVLHMDDRKGKKNEDDGDGNEEGKENDDDEDEEMKDFGKKKNEDDGDDEDDEDDVMNRFKQKEEIKIHLQLGKSKGSGYPSDPNTKAWMNANCDRVFGFPTFVRFSWGTTKTLLEKKAVQVDWESDEEDEVNEPASKQPRVKTKDIKSFFTGGGAKSSKASKDKTTKAKGAKNGNTPTRTYPMALKALSVKRATTIF